MAELIYYSIPQLARRLNSELSEEEFKQLIRELVSNNTAEFHEYRRDSLAAGNYAPIVKACLACGRPI